MNFKEFLNGYKTKFLVFFSVFGPATITALADNDAAGVATYSLAGAKYGYSILFILFLVTILLAVTQEMGVRIALVSGKGLGDIIRERYGVKISVLVFLGLMFANLGTTIANFSAIKITASLFNLPVIPFVILIIVTAYMFVSKGNYQTNQKIFLISGLFYITYVISAFKANPDWPKALSSIFVPTNIKLSKDFIFATIAVLGTTITPWGQFFVHSFVLDKKLTSSKLKYEQVETYFGAFLTNFFSFFMIVATASTLFIYKIPLTSGEQAAIAIEPFAGKLASILFGLGIMNAGFMGIIVVSLTTAYAFSEFFGYEGSLDSDFKKGQSFYVIFLTQLSIAALINLIPKISLFKIVFFTQSLNGVLLPLMFFFLLKASSDPELMGKHINSRWFNYFIIGVSILISFASLITLIGFFL